MREEKEGGFFDCQRWKGAQEWKREIAARVLPGTLLVLFYLFVLLFWYSRLHSTLDSLAIFEKFFLLIGVDIEGHLFALLNRNFPSSLLCYDCVLDFSDFFL